MEGRGGTGCVCVWGGACMCGVWAETEAERHSQAKDNAVCVCVCACVCARTRAHMCLVWAGGLCVCGGEAVCGVLCGMCGRVRSVLRAGGGVGGG